MASITYAFLPSAPSFTRPAASHLGAAPTDTPEVAVTSTPFQLKDYFAAKLPAVEAALQASIVSTEPETEKICESMLYSLMAGGKRIRPILCLAAAEMFVNSDANSDDAAALEQQALDMAMPTAVAIEMIHTMSLIHDDLPAMDNDDLRRGKPTNHVRIVYRVYSIYTSSGIFVSHSHHLPTLQVVYGEDVAILAGDALLSTSFQHVAEATPPSLVPPDRIVSVLARLGASVGAQGLAGGQVMDLLCEAKSDATLDELRWIHTHKTAALLQVAVSCGALLAGASAKDVKACEEFALKIGLAFQVADDILDVTQTTQELGKTAGKDESVDKTTYPKLLGLDGAREEAERLVAEAKAALEPYGEKATPLLALADYIIDRKN